MMADCNASRWRGALMLLLTVALTDATAASKVYRCGNVFQDQPCPEAKPAGTASLAPSATVPIAASVATGCGAVKGGPSSDRGCAAPASHAAAPPTAAAR